MSEITAYPLEHLAIVSIAGVDTKKFLQGQCTQDMSALQKDTAIPGAFCTAKGRTVSNVCLVDTDNSVPLIQMVCHQSSAEPLTSHLSKYIAFFRGTELKNNDRRYHGIGLSGTDSQSFINSLQLSPKPHFSALLPDGRSMIWLDSLAGDYEQILEKIEELSFLPSTHWQKMDIENKILWLEALQTESWIPQNFNLDTTGGISFNKGCYTGQEVVARLHFKGQSKKRLYSLSWPSNTGLSVDKVYLEQGSAGDVVQTTTIQNQTYALAILKSESAEKALFIDEKRQVAIQLLN